MDLKQLVAQAIVLEGKTFEEIYDLITIVPSNQQGDFALPCFSFAKELKKSPMLIAEELAKNLKSNEYIEKTEVVAGYLNFFLNRTKIANLVISEFEKENFFVDKEPAKHYVVEYSSPNLAKFMHIGHYNCTIYGEAIAKMEEFFGNKVTRINYVGDYGTPFGKMVVAIKKWGDLQDIEDRGIDAIQELYIKFNQEENELLMQQARQASKNIEEKEGQDYEIYKKIVDVSVQKVKDITSLLGIKFDDWRGESTYNKDLKNIVEELKAKGLAKESQGAQIVDLSDSNLGISVIERSDGASLYITRDLCAIEDRYKRYNFDKHIYVTALQQDLHFAQLIEITKRLNRPYKDKLQHISYGMFSTPEGKIASRKGKQALLEDTLNEAISKAKEIIATRNLSEKDKDYVAKEIAKGAMAFSIFKVEASKDKIFDLQTAISFDGDTSPYLQYTYARLRSLIKKSKVVQTESNQSFDFYNQDRVFDIIKQIANFKNIFEEARRKYEPALIARAVLDVAKQFNSLYAETQILNTSDQKEKLVIVEMLAETLKTALGLLCINVLEEM